MSTHGKIYTSLEEDVASGKLKRLGCIGCRFINYIVFGDPEICELCNIPLKSVEECERLILLIARLDKATS